MKYIDLHTHTHYSDGTTSPAQNAKDAALIGLDAIAITDHDTVKGVKEATDEGEKWGLKVIPGVEVSTTKCHMLGYMINPKDSGLQDMLLHIGRVHDKITQNRLKEIQAKTGLPITYKKIRTYFPDARLGKYNIVIGILRDAECQKITGKMPAQAVYNQYVKVFGSGQVKELLPTPKEAIRVINNAGGLAVVAHPFLDFDEPSQLEELVGAGLFGVEVQPNFGSSNDEYVKFAKEHNLQLTYGSDYHGPSFHARPMLGRKENKIQSFWG